MTQIRRAAKVLIRRATDGKYLMLTCSLWPENPRRSQKPDLPGGLIEEHEHIEEGLIREVSEETGIDLPFEKLKLGYCLTYQENDTVTSFMLYVAELDGSPDITISWEHESYDWLALEEVMGLDIRPPYPDIFKHLNKINLLV